MIVAALSSTGWRRGKVFEGKPGIGAVKPVTGKGGWMEASTVGDRKRKRNILMWRGLEGDWAGNCHSFAFIGTRLGFSLVLQLAFLLGKGCD